MVSSSCFFSSLLSHLHPRRHSRCSNHARISPSDITSAPQEFEAGLHKELQKLIYGEGDYCLNVMSFTWICKALDAVIATQKSVNATQKSVKYTVSVSTMPAAGGPMADRMIQQFTEDSVKMLDACCLLKETLAGRHAHVKASLRALKRLQGLKMAHRGEIQRAKHTLLLAQRVQGWMQQQTVTKHRLQACTSLLRRMSKKLSPSLRTHHHHPHLVEMASSSACVDAVPAALYGGEMSALFFLSLLSMALSSPASSSSSLKTASNRLSGRPVWGPSLLVLQAQLNTHILHLEHKQRTQDLGTLLPELHTLDASLHRIRQALLQPPSSIMTQQAKDNNVSILVSSTIALAADVQSSMARLQHQLDCISSSIVDTRMALLESSALPWRECHKNRYQRVINPMLI